MARGNRQEGGGRQAWAVSGDVPDSTSSHREFWSVGRSSRSAFQHQLPALRSSPRAPGGSRAQRCFWGSREGDGGTEQAERSEQPPTASLTVDALDLFSFNSETISSLYPAHAQRQRLQPVGQEIVSLRLRRAGVGSTFVPA